MKLVIEPILICTEIEYKAEIEPTIKQLDEMDLCPYRNENRNTTWNCDTFEDCSCCPFGKANMKIQEALKILKNIEIKNFLEPLDK